MSSTICRLCLASDTPIYTLAKTPLQEVYEALSRNALNASNKPVTACYLCLAQLKKCQNFMSRTMKADDLLTQILESGRNIDQETISKIDRETYNLTDPRRRYTLFSIEMKYTMDMKGHIETEEIVDDMESKIETVPMPIEMIKIEPCEDTSETEDGVLLPFENVQIKMEIEIEDLEIKTPHSETSSPVKNQPYDTDTTVTIENISDTRTSTGIPIAKPQYDSEKCKEKLTKTEFACDICKYRFTSKKILDEHFPICKSNGKTCPICQKIFTRKNHLKEHLQIHTGEKLHVCSFCEKRFGSRNGLSKHLKSHGEKTFKCPTCKEIFSEITQYREHKKTHASTSKILQCQICERIFKSKSKLEKHLGIHRGEKPYQCAVCKRRFHSNSNLKKHIRIHTGEKPYECSICQYKFTCRSNLLKHVKRHTGNKTFSCTICTYKCFENDSLVRHLRIHTGEKPYQCCHCEERFTYKGDLNSHLILHSGVTPFQCYICTRKFFKKSNLITHLTTHSSQKPFQCAECPYRCKRKGNLKSHLKIHFGGKPFKCTYCDSTFSRKSDRNKHMATHNDQTEKSNDAVDGEL